MTIQHFYDFYTKSNNICPPFTSQHWKLWAGIKSNTIILYPHLLGSKFLVNFTAPKKQISTVNFVFKSLDHTSNL